MFFVLIWAPLSQLYLIVFCPLRSFGKNDVLSPDWRLDNALCCRSRVVSKCIAQLLFSVSNHFVDFILFGKIYFLRKYCVLLYKQRKTRAPKIRYFVNATN